MELAQAIDIISQALAQYRGTKHEHDVIQQALSILVRKVHEEKKE